ncbi:MAG: hypothetical protein ACI4HN_09500 [Ruminococcus sp.]
MKIKVIKEFIDRENDMIHRKVGETFEADEPRAKHLEQLGFVEKKPRKKADESVAETTEETK